MRQNYTCRNCVTCSFECKVAHLNNINKQQTPKKLKRKYRSREWKGANKKEE